MAYPLAEQAMVVPVFILLGVARGMILLLPFRFYAPVLGEPAHGQDASPAPLAPRHEARARAVGRVVRATAKVTPWQSLCLAQALAAVAMLRLFAIPSTVYLGLAKGVPGGDPLKAHAWIKAGEATLTGAHRGPRYTIVATFRRTQRAERPCSPV